MIDYTILLYKIKVKIGKNVKNGNSSARAHSQTSSFAALCRYRSCVCSLTGALLIAGHMCLFMQA